MISATVIKTSIIPAAEIRNKYSRRHTLARPRVEVQSETDEIEAVVTKSDFTASRNNIPGVAGKTPGYPATNAVVLRQLINKMGGGEPISQAGQLLNIQV